MARDLAGLALDFRAQLLRREARAMADMDRAYRIIQPRLDAELAAIRRSITAARPTRHTPADLRSLLYREGRILRLQRLVAEQLTRFSVAAHETTIAHAQAAATASTADAAAMVRNITPPGLGLDTVRLPTATIEVLASSTQRSAAVGRLFAQIAPQAAQAASDVLLSSVALGHHPNQIASELRDTLKVPLSRAKTIARTEAMRAYREGTRQEYQANDATVRGWIWVSALDKTTCASCIAQHGSLHPLDEQMSSHPSCRCVMAPQSVSWRDLGFTQIGDPAPIETGPHWFNRQDSATQAAIVGPTKHRAIRGRQITLPDLVERSTSPAWGPSTSEASLVVARRNAAQRRLAA